jgi:F-box/WD-40 domain protein MET30
VHNLIRLDPFALFPREVSLKVLSYLDAFSLGMAVQVSRDWKTLADDDLLWRGMCVQHIERKCTKCESWVRCLTLRFGSVWSG